MHPISISAWKIRNCCRKPVLNTFCSLFSAAVLFMIFYFAVTKTYITITPEINIKTRWKNFIFREMEIQEESVRENLIQLRKVSKVLYLEDVYATTGIDEMKVERSSGKIIIINKYPENVKLFPRTRFQTSTWVLLQLDSPVQIPAATEENGKVIPGTIEVKVTSQTRDAFWKLVWEWANISKDLPLVLPWLKEWQDMLYAQTTSDFTGAREFKNWFIISELDIENAKKMESLQAEDIANAIVYAVESPNHVNVNEILIRPTTQDR